MSAKIKLTPEIQQQILASVRSGGYAHVAAAAWGVPHDVWEKWHRRGTGPRPTQPYKDFFLKLEQAEGQARLKAEMAAMDADPRFWLKHGPGKEQPHSPGWAAMPKAVVLRGAGSELVITPELLELLGKACAILAPHPDAQAAMKQLLDP